VFFVGVPILLDSFLFRADEGIASPPFKGVWSFLVSVPLTASSVSLEFISANQADYSPYKGKTPHHRFFVVFRPLPR